MSLDLTAARAIADAALAEAERLGLRVSCSVANEKGQEILTLHMDGAGWFTAGVSRAKARTSAIMGRASGQLAGLKSEYPDLWELIQHQIGPDATTLPGGIVVTDGDRVIGGVGISGAHPDQDIACAEAGVATWRSA